MLLTLAFEGGLLVLAVGLGIFLAVPFWKDLGTMRDLGVGLVLCAPLVLAVIIVAEKSSDRVSLLREDFTNVVRIFEGGTTLDLLIVSLLAGVCEEALFRGFLQNWLAGWGIVPAVLITAVVFGFAHAISWQYFIFAALISIYLSGVYTYTGALVAPIALHAAYDFALLVYGTRYWSARPAPAH